MEQRLSLVTLGVSDLASSRAFYERLGWKASGKYQAIAFFQMGGMGLALFSRASLAEDAKLADDGPLRDGAFCGMTLAINARSREAVDTMLAEAVAAGAKLIKPAHAAEWGGYSGYFADPDGFPWEIAWNPFFPMAEDGSITIPQ